MSSNSLTPAPPVRRWRFRILVGMAVAALLVGAGLALRLGPMWPPARMVSTGGPSAPPVIAPIISSAEPLSDPPVVVTVQPQRQTIHRAIRQPGTIEAFERTPVHARVAGYVEKVYVDIGDRVRQGDALAKQQVPELEEEVNEKEALVTQAIAEVEQARQGLATAEAAIDTAKALIQVAEAGRARTKSDYERWEGEYKRVQELVQRQVIDSQIRDETLNQFKSSEAARDETEAKVKAAEAALKESITRRDKAKADVQTAAARLAVTEANHRRMAAWLEYATLRAPFDGVVSARNIDTGHFLQPAGSGGKTEPLFIVERIDTVRILVDVPEADAVAVKVGTPAVIHVQGIAGLEIPAQVTRSSWSLEARERTLRVEINLPNSEGRLRPGMYAYAVITLEYADRLTLPATAVVKQGDQTFCYRVEGGKAVRMPIKVGFTSGERLEVLQKRTKTGADGWEEFTGEEEIVDNNLQGLSDGQMVRKSLHK